VALTIGKGVQHFNTQYFSILFAVVFRYWAELRSYRSTLRTYRLRARERGVLLKLFILAY